jgi:hypothetical protein
MSADIGIDEPDLRVCERNGWRSRVNTPGRTVSSWWDRHNNAFYLERLVSGSTAPEEPESRSSANERPAIGLLWRPISFPRSASAKARAARANATLSPDLPNAI